jgi:divalent metal cation (Fe/Co/Zn/Cd) transporter
MTEATVDPRTGLLSHALRLEALTIGWNVLEAAIAITAGALAGSIALVGFGLDSVIETVAASALYSRLRAELRGTSGAEIENQERLALRIVGVTFLVLAAYILYEAGMTLWTRQAPQESTIGIVLASVSLVVMPILAFAKLRVGQQLESRALIADSKETFVCSYLSLALLLGLGGNALFGAWWADPVAALLMLPWVTKEGLEALRDDCDD